MSSTFTPPATSTVPPVLPPGTPGQTPLQYRLWRHYRNRPEGINVYILSDGTVTEADPDTQTVFWQASDGSPYVVRAFYGGHDDYVISDAENILLTAEGYTTGSEPGPPPDPEEPPTSVDNAILTESGDALLTESGDTLIVES